MVSLARGPERKQEGMSLPMASSLYVHELEVERNGLKPGILFPPFAFLRAEHGGLRPLPRKTQRFLLQVRSCRAPDRTVSNVYR